MGTVVQVFEAPAGYSTGSVTAEFFIGGGTTVTPPSWAFTNPGTSLEVTFPFKAVSYDGASNISVTIDWYAQTGAITGSVDWKVWIVSQAAGAAESMEAADNATLGATLSSTVNGTAKGPTRVTGSITQANADGLAADNIAYVRVQRSTSNTTLADTAELKSVTISYSDGLANPSSFVSGPASAVSGNLPSYSGTTGKLIADSGIAAANVVQGPASTLASNLAGFNGSTGKLLYDSGIPVANVVQCSTTSTTTAIVKWASTTGTSVANSGVLIDASNNVTGMGTLNTRTIANLVDGPASSTSGNLASYNGTTGKTVQDSGVAAASVVVGPASAVSGNIATYNGTTGKLVQDSGVSATAHAARHNVGGADAIFSGTWNSGDIAYWNGSSWVPKFHQSVILTSAFAVTSTTLADVTGLSVTLTRAGSYAFRLGGGVTATTATAMSMAMNYTGTVTSVGGSGVISTPSAGWFLYANQVANNAQANAATGTAATGNHVLDFRGGITVSTSGTLSFRYSRATSGGTTNIVVGTCLTINEI